MQNFLEEDYNMEINKEIEIKFSWPEQIDESEIIEGFRKTIEKQSWKVLSEKTNRRNYIYYDTSQFEIYRANETLRRVGGFDKKRNRSGFSYDYKTGPLDCRLITKYWCNEILSSREIIENLSLPFQEVVPTIPAETYHRILSIEKNQNLLEVKFDNFYLFDGIGFGELEIEILSGKEKFLQELAIELQLKLGLLRVREQKYIRAVNLKKLIPLEF